VKTTGGIRQSEGAAGSFRARPRRSRGRGGHTRRSRRDVRVEAMKHRPQVLRPHLLFLFLAALPACERAPTGASVPHPAPPALPVVSFSRPSPPEAPSAWSAAPSAADTPSAATPDAVAESRSARPIDPFTIRDDQGRAIEVYPPLGDASRSPIVVMLHATCMQPASVCNWFGDAARDTGWLVCPSGNGTCAGEPDWEGSGGAKAAFLERAIARVEERVGPFVDEAPGVLIGWSRGAFAARDMVVARRDLVSRHFAGLVLIAAQVAPDAATLRAAGIRRVVMAAGDYDLSRPMMVGAIDSLKRAGMDARYVSLGKIGHVWPADFERTMREPIAWAAERD
jgi:predicted esterase